VNVPQGLPVQPPGIPGFGAGGGVNVPPDLRNLPVFRLPPVEIRSDIPPAVYRPVIPESKPGKPIRWEDVPWGLLLTIGVVLFVAAAVVGFNHARRAA
jgi:hypothetical protein